MPPCGVYTVLTQKTPIQKKTPTQKTPVPKRLRYLKDSDLRLNTRHRIRIGDHRPTYRQTRTEANEDFPTFGTTLFVGDVEQQKRHLGG